MSLKKSNGTTLLEMPLPNDLPVAVALAAALGHVFQYVGGAWACIWCEAEVKRVERKDCVYYESNQEARVPCPEVQPSDHELEHPHPHLHEEP